MKEGAKEDDAFSKLKHNVNKIKFNKKSVNKTLAMIKAQEHSGSEGE